MHIGPSSSLAPFVEAHFRGEILSINIAPDRLLHDIVGLSPTKLAIPINHFGGLKNKAKSK